MVLVKKVERGRAVSGKCIVSDKKKKRKRKTHQESDNPQLLMLPAIFDFALALESHVV
jgi:hypothetical protein